MSKGRILNASTISGMDKFMALARIAVGICDEADKIGASEYTDAELIVRARELFPSKPYCLVREWVLVDLSDTEGLEVPEGALPRVVYAGKVVDDQADRFDRPRWILSTFELSLVEGHLFESMNTIYVLSGRGARATCDWRVLASLF